MRNWHRSAIAFTTWPPVSSTRRRKTSVGVAAYGSGRTPRQSNTRSAMPHHRLTPVPQAGEEAVDALPGLLAAVEALPVRPYQPDQRVAGVDRHEVGAGVAVDEERLDVRFDV